MALCLSPCVSNQQTVKRAACSSRCRARLVCKAVLNLEPKQAFVERDGALKRDVSAKAAGAEDAALPLPDQPEQPPRVVTPSLLNTIIDNTVRVPYNAYSRALAEHPFTTKALTSMVGFILGDLISQRLGHPHAAIDIWRAMRLGAYGLLIDGPVGSKWYDVLEQYVFPQEPLSTKAVLAKTALDQVVYATVMTVVYFAVIRCLEGHPEAIWATLQAKYIPTLAANYMIWPLAHLVNFRFVPSEYRILYNNVVCVAWLTGLSFLTHSKINFMQLLHFPAF